ncbi:MAG: hypothetical protein OXI01_23375 [Albidovulum sp.]|nr:hypothetical protein [Albidovulum sp.]
MNRTDPEIEPAPSMQMTADRQRDPSPGRDASNLGNGELSLASIEAKLDSLTQVGTFRIGVALAANKFSN